MHRGLGVLVRGRNHRRLRRRRRGTRRRVLREIRAVRRTRRHRVLRHPQQPVQHPLLHWRIDCGSGDYGGALAVFHPPGVPARILRSRASVWGLGAAPALPRGGAGIQCAASVPSIFFGIECHRLCMFCVIHTHRVFTAESARAEIWHILPYFAIFGITSCDCHSTTGKYAIFWPYRFCFWANMPISCFGMSLQNMAYFGQIWGGVLDT